jgi:hypothetical protein
MAYGLDVRSEKKRNVKCNLQISQTLKVICESNLTPQNLKSPRVHFKAMDELIVAVLDEKQRFTFVSNITQQVLQENFKRSF